LPEDASPLAHRLLPRDIPGRRIPELTAFSELEAPDLVRRAVPMPQANTLAHLNYARRRFGRIQLDSTTTSLFNPEIVLVKFRGEPLVSALRVEPVRELDAVQALRRRADVEFAELDTFERRQFTPNDPMLATQWHHSIIGSYQAWDLGLGSQAVRVAIVDTPFQMDHPDLVANTVNGWDIVANQSVTSSTGIVHSTICAGMVAAAINNSIGGAGVANCRILPININGAISEMYNATLWAASNGVRVVNISWSGATNSTLEAAGYFFRTNAGGILVMSAIDGNGLLNGPNQPDVYCISMTDAADNFQGTMHGNYIDFAAPGFNIFSTTTGGGYTYGTGCSYAAPLFAGVVAWIIGTNPTLGPSDVIAILTNTAVNLGPVQYYGWGRVDFARAASAAAATLPNIQSARWTNHSAIISVNYRPEVSYSFFRTTQLSPPDWMVVSNATISTNGNTLELTDPSPPAANAYYRVSVSAKGWQ
jgi:subtilisin family serine protease